MADGQEDGPAPGLDFYISYASRDRLWAEWAGATLMSAGYTVELDVWNWLPGDNIVLAREAALRRARRVLALCSAAYFGGGFPEQDWTSVMAAPHGKPGRLVPVWIDDLDGRKLPDLLRSVQPIKLSGLSEAEAHKHFLAALAGDLGPDGTPAFPGPAGQKATEQIAAAGPRLPGQHQPAVSHVPPRNPDFSGRDGLLIQMREKLPSATAGMVILQGPGGMGKTQLSIEYAHRFAADYDTVWAIDSEQPELITSQLADLAVAMGAATAMADAQTAATAALAALRDRGRWLVVFDNVEDPGHLASFLPGGPGHVLVTTRAGMWQKIAPLIAVEEFSRAESTAMLTTRVTALTLADADQIAAALGDLPLALAQAAGALQSGLPAAEFQRMLAGQATLILSQGKPRSYATTLAAATLIALDKLAATSPEAANLLRLCGYLAPESISATWFSRPAAYADLTSAAKIIPLPVEMLATIEAFRHIRDLGLGRVDQNGLRLHRLTQAILRDHTADHQTAYQEVVSAILAAAAPPDSDDPANWPEWSRLVPHMLAVAPENAPASFRPLACAAARYLLVNGQAKAALTLTTRLHQAWTAALGPDDPDTLTAAQHLAHATHATGDYATALDIHQDTLARRRRVLADDHPDTLHSANDLAVSLSSLGRKDEARALNQDTYDRRRRVLGADHPETLTAASNLAMTLDGLGQRKEALALHQDTYNRIRQVLGDDHPRTSACADNLAASLAGLGQKRAALRVKGQRPKPRAKAQKSKKRKKR